MLIRKKDESIMVGDDVLVTVLEIRRDFVRLGVRAPSEVEVDRPEIRQKKRRDGYRRQQK